MRKKSEREVKVEENKENRLMPIMGVAYNLHKDKDGWVVVKIIYQEGAVVGLERIGSPDYKTIAMERCRRLVYGSWF